MNDHMNPATPESADAAFLAALASANPVTDADLPSATAPEARNVLAEAMRSTIASADSASTDTTTAAAAVATNATLAAQPAATFSAPPAATARGARARLTSENAAPKRRRWPMLVGVAAASAALIGGGLVFLPDNTQPAIALVHEAASRTSDANTGRIVATFSAEGSDQELDGSVVGEVTSVFDGEDFSLAIEIDDTSGVASELVGAELPVAETRLVDGVIYLNPGDDKWFGVEAPEFLGTEVTDLIDPRTVLTTVQELVDTEEIGTVTIDGVDTTHYRSVTDIGDGSLTETGWVAGLASREGIDSDGLVTIDLFVDGEGRMRQLDITGDLSAAGEGEATFTIETKFLDLGADLDVVAPEGVEVSSIFDGLAELEGSFEAEFGD